MKILLRSDGNEYTGYGHLLRLNAFAEILKKNFKIKFLTRDNSNIKLLSKWIDPEYIPSYFNSTEEINLISNNYAGYIIILDGYQFDEIYQKELKSKGFKLIYIDDMANSYMYADCVLNHAIGLNKINYRGENYTKYFLGSEFALLRQGFLENAKLKTFENVNFKKAFVSFGGTNSSKLTLNAVKALLNFKNFSKIYVVIGKAITNKSTLNYFFSNEKIELLIDIGEEVLIQIMKDSDLFIVPSSTIAYELASMRKIIASGYTAHNQKFLYKGLTNSNIIFEMGDISNFEVKDFNHYITNILQTPVEILNSKIRSQILHFDGNQEHRLTEIVNSLAIL